MMKPTTTLSAEGRITIPVDVRNRLQLREGDDLDCEVVGDAVLLRRAVPESPGRSGQGGSVKSGRSFEEVSAYLRTIIKYDGPPISVEAMQLTDADFDFLYGHEYPLAGR